MRVLITGANGFVGKNLSATLRTRHDVELFEHGRGGDPARLRTALGAADVVFHLAGVNRPRRVEEFATGNAGFTAEVCGMLREAGRRAKVVLTSSIQADLDNPYGKSKRAAELELERHCAATGAEGAVYRLKNLFGKWSRPGYNTVTATFCHNIARGLPVEISDPACVLSLTDVDDVVDAFVAELERPRRPGCHLRDPLPSYDITLGELAATLRGFLAQRETLALPDCASKFTRALYATYLSFVEPERHGYVLASKADGRGSLAEFVKSPHGGQLFVSRTKPGVTRGDHWHRGKAEKFMVVEGEGVIRLRDVHGTRVIEFAVRGDEYRVVDIPPGYVHSIENVGAGELVTLFWASEIFDPARPDTFALPVKP